MNLKQYFFDWYEGAYLRHLKREKHSLNASISHAYEVSGMCMALVVDIYLILVIIYYRTIGGSSAASSFIAFLGMVALVANVFLIKYLENEYEKERNLYRNYTALEIKSKMRFANKISIIIVLPLILFVGYLFYKMYVLNQTK